MRIRIIFFLVIPVFFHSSSHTMQIPSSQPILVPQKDTVSYRTASFLVQQTIEGLTAERKLTFKNQLDKSSFIMTMIDELDEITLLSLEAQRNTGEKTCPEGLTPLQVHILSMREEILASGVVTPK